jgi:ribosomal protein S6--L-glutamate ligase
LSGPPVIIIENNTDFTTHYHSLNEHSIVNCRLRLIPGEEHVLTDLLERCVTLIPSASSQLASRSKVYQARIFSRFMLPNTIPIYDKNGLLEATSIYHERELSQVIVKQDRKNGGIGIHRFRNIEDVYNRLSLDTFEQPVVLQPFIENFRDIRVIWLGEYREAYERVNPTNFRRNLHCGGSAIPYELDADILQFCSEVMQRGAFPYAHIDVMQTPEGALYLTEINLRGGLLGAKIEAHHYHEIIAEIHRQLLNTRLRHT